VLVVLWTKVKPVVYVAKVKRLQRFSTAIERPPQATRFKLARLNRRDATRGWRPPKPALKGRPKLKSRYAATEIQFQNSKNLTQSERTVSYHLYLAD
jgi:hypothetical protein